jgi:hypothetical protein
VKTFFICGSQRSGTTMMRLILDSHPKIHCFGELTAYRIFEQNISHDRFPEAEAKQFEIAGFQTPIWTELFVEYESIAKFCEDSPIIFMIRNPLDCIGSMTKVGLNRMDWIIKNVYQQMLAWYFDENRTLQADFGEVLEPLFETLAAHKEKMELLLSLTENRVRAKVSLLRLPCDELFALCAVYWKYKNLAFKRMLENNYKVLGVDYNDCVIHPRKEIGIIADFIGIPWDNKLLLHHRLPHTETRVGWAIGNTRADRPIDLKSINRRKELSEKETHLINELTGEFYEQLRSLIHQ